MEFFQMGIKEIFSITENKRTVWVDFVEDFYGGPQRVQAGFLKHEWEVIRARKVFSETSKLTENGVKYFEGLTDDQWYVLRFGAKLKDFTDEEIVEEFNRRLNDRVFHKIEFVGRAEIRER